MPNWFMEGGWGMWPVSAFGLLMLGVAVRYAVKPESRMVPLVVSTGVLTLLSGMLGFVTGLIATFHAVGQVKPDERYIALIGLGESLNNLSLAFALMTLSMIVVVVGAYRLSRSLATVSAASP